jgi:menaquinol-cytochrome c reductase iron-sulfur subunit
LPDRRKSRSKYTLERNIPGAFEGETVTRRRAMVLFANGVGAVGTAAIALPALGFALAPVFKAQPMAWQAVGSPSDFTEDNYVIKVITLVPGIGEAGLSIAYLRTRNPSLDTEPEDQYNHYIALSSRCMHLGCPVRWVDAAARFVCPCHGGVYNIRGIPVGGPPVRPLDRFYTRLNQSTGLVEVGPRYSVNMELRRFSPRDPAEPLDGIGQYLYPARWSTNPLPKG